MVSTKQKRFPGDRWFQAKVRKMTLEELDRKEFQFAKKHNEDTDGQLIQYVRKFAVELGRTPNACEIIGGSFIAQRFGGWEVVISAAMLPPPRKAALPEHRLIYKQVYQQTEQVFRQMRQDEKLKRQLYIETKSEKRSKEAEIIRERDHTWWEIHQTYSDDELLSYIQQCAYDLGRSPFSADVEGGYYLAQHLVHGHWHWSLRDWIYQKECSQQRTVFV